MAHSARDRALFDVGLMLENAGRATGVRLAFRSDTRSVAGRVERLVVNSQAARCPGAAAMDVRCDGELVASAPLAGEERFSFDGLPAGEKQIELWLPPFAYVRLYGLELDDGASLAPADDPRLRWVAYGSSITSAMFPVDHPSELWPAKVAREAGLNLTCLGLAGQCHLDPMVARMIRDIPADYLSAKVAVNALNSRSLNARSFRPALIGFLLTVRDGHPITPFAVISPVCWPEREAVEGGPGAGFTIRAMRQEIAETIELLRARGDRRLYYVDGLRLLGPDHADLLEPDGVHPSAAGYDVLAQNFLREVIGPVFAGSGVPVSATH